MCLSKEGRCGNTVKRLECAKKLSPNFLTKKKLREDNDFNLLLKAKDPKFNEFYATLPEK